MIAYVQTTSWLSAYIDVLAKDASVAEMLVLEE